MTRKKGTPRIRRSIKPLKKPPKKNGRPEIYTDELSNEFLRRLATSTNSIKKICESPDMPSHDTIFKWLWEDTGGFTDRYRRAREAQQLVFADEILDIADNSKLDTVLDERGNERENREWVNRSKLRVHARQWLMERTAPKYYVPQPAPQPPPEKMKFEFEFRETGKGERIKVVEGDE